MVVMQNVPFSDVGACTHLHRYIYPSKKNAYYVYYSIDAFEKIIIIE